MRRSRNRNECRRDGKKKKRVEDRDKNNRRCGPRFLICMTPEKKRKRVEETQERKWYKRRSKNCTKNGLKTVRKVKKNSKK